MGPQTKETDTPQSVDETLLTPCSYQKAAQLI